MAPVLLITPFSPSWKYMEKEHYTFPSFDLLFPYEQNQSEIATVKKRFLQKRKGEIIRHPYPRQKGSSPIGSNLKGGYSIKAKIRRRK